MKCSATSNIDYIHIYKYTYTDEKPLIKNAYK